MLFCLHIGKIRSVFHGVTAVPADGPGNISIPIVVALKGKTDPVHIHGTLALCRFQQCGQCLNAALNRIFRILDAVRRVRVLLVVTALGSLHGIFAFASGFLHHDGLDQFRILTDPVLTGIFRDHIGVGFHFRTNRSIVCRTVITEKIKCCAEQNADHHDHQANDSACRQGGNKSFHAPEQIPKPPSCSLRGSSGLPAGFLCTADIHQRSFPGIHYSALFCKLLDRFLFPFCFCPLQLTSVGKVFDPRASSGNLRVFGKRRPAKPEISAGPDGGYRAFRLRLTHYAADPSC